MTKMKSKYNGFSKTKYNKWHFTIVAISRTNRMYTIHITYILYCVFWELILLTFSTKLFLFTQKRQIRSRQDKIDNYRMVGI